MSGNSFVYQNNIDTGNLTVASDRLHIERKVISDAHLETFQKILGLYSDSKISDDIWILKRHQERFQKKIEFGMSIESADKVLLKAFVLSQIAVDLTLSTCKRKLYDCVEFYNFIKNLGIHIESTNNVCLELFIKYLGSHLTLNEAQRLSIVSSVRDLLQFASEQGVFNKIIFVLEPDEGWIQSDNVRRAPEDCVIEQLDSWFLDLKNKVPLDYRCTYLTLRLIIGRFAEVQSILLNDIHYPAENMFNVRIPTFKETPLHIWTYNVHTRFRDGLAEQVLLDTLLHQQEYARSVQDRLNYTDKGYLMVSSQTGSSLMTNEQFNKYLAEVCLRKSICNADGNIAHVTSHHLRHVTIIERIESRYSSIENARKEACHQNRRTTLGYSYRSEINEFELNQKVVSKVFSEIFLDKSHGDYEILSKKKYEKLESQPFVRLIPGLGLCSDCTCIPRYERCLKCNEFEPESCYKECFLECIQIVEKRMERYNEYTAKEAIDFDNNLLAIYNLYLDRIQSRTEHYKIG